MLVSAFKDQVNKTFDDYFKESGIKVRGFYHRAETYGDKYDGFTVYQGRKEIGLIGLHKGKIKACKTGGEYLNFDFAFQALAHITKGMVKGRMEIFQPNPTEELGKCTKGDCAIRAICKLSNLEWREAFDMLCTWAREHFTLPNSLNDTLVPYLEANGYEKVSTPDRPTAREFAETHPSGTYYIHAQSRYGCHAITCIDGTLYDAWDSSECHLYYAMIKNQ